MKKNYSSLLIIPAVIVFLFSASISYEKNVSDYSGVYRITDADVCGLVITIKKRGKGYTYIISGAGIKSSGKLSVVRNGGETYFKFNGTLRGGDRTPVEGSYEEKKITIQNYGNSINQFICFKQCDAKFLEFVKK